MKKLGTLLVASLCAGTALAQPVTTTDDSAATAPAAAPPGMQSPGQGASDGGQIGRPAGSPAVVIQLDTNLLGELEIDVIGGTCGSATDVAVIYLDTAPGGFTSTAPLTDVSSLSAAAASGTGMTSGTGSDLVFAPAPDPFAADYAIAITTAAPATATLFQLVGGGAHVATTLTVTVTGSSSSPCGLRQIRGLSLSNLGLSTGGGFNWVATLLDGATGARSNEFHGVAVVPVVAPIVGRPVLLGVGDYNSFLSVPMVVINEVDSDTLGTDTAEFIELLALGARRGGIRMDGTVIVGFNGSVDASYRTLDLDGVVTDADGYAILGNAAILGADVIFADESLQSGEDALALFLGDAGDFPTGTAVTADRLVDAVVYDTDDVDDVELLATLTPGQPQINENANGLKDTDSIGRCPNGSGGYRMTGTYRASLATPRASNTCDLCGNGTVDVGEDCDDGTANGAIDSCCTGTCGFQPVGSMCGDADATACDAMDTCNATGACVDNVDAMGTTCRAAASACDIAEACDGTSAGCPADAVEAADTVCRASADACDAAEACDGVAPTCPADELATADTTCRPAAGDCDAAEACDGVAPTCPADELATADTTCRPAAGDCDVAELCSGVDADCPTDVFVANGTACADLLVCDGSETCTDGVCAGTPVDCDDSDACTADMCEEPGGCTNVDIAGCCTEDSDCDDSDVCTTDSCTLGTLTCANAPIAGCGVDAGVDAGLDAGLDAGTDSGSDAGTDAGRDAGGDADPGDAGRDSGMDAELPDGGDDAGDAGEDAGEDASPDAMTDDGGDADITGGGPAGGAGCDCRTTGGSGSAAWALLFFAMVGFRRRRR